MKAAVTAVTVVMLCAALAAHSQPAPGSASRAHYVLRDAGMYGYEPAVSDNERAAGVRAAELVMVGYAGERAGVHQVIVLTPPRTVTVSQCAVPCDFIKIMRFEGGKLQASTILRGVPGTIGHMALTDAINGRLQRYVDVKHGSLYVWCDAVKGCAAEARTAGSKAK